MDFAELLAKAERALAAGDVTEAQVATDLARLTQGKITSLAALRSAARVSGLQLARPAERGVEGQLIIRPRDLARAAAQGATLGFSDEIAGLLAGLVPGGKTREEARAGTRAGLQLFRQEAPRAALGAELAGGLATAALPMGAMGAGAAVARGAVPGLARTAVGGAATGAAVGGVAGAGYAEGGAGERLAGAERGAAFGALLGGMLPVSIRAATWLSSKGLPFMEAVLAPEGAARRIARQRMSQAMKDAGLSAKDVTAVMESLGERAIPADVSLAAGREARSALQQAPAVEQVAQDFLAGRQAGAGERLATGLAEGAGLPGGVNLVTAKQAAKTATRAVAKKVYAPLEELYPTLAGDDAAAFEALFEAHPEMATVWERIKPRGETGLNFKNLQSLAQRLEDDTQAAFKAGRGNEGTNLRGMREELNDLMEESMPGFRAANRDYAESAATLRAFDKGAKAMGQSADQIAADITKLGDNADAVKAYRTGMVDTIGRRLRSVRQGQEATRGLADAGPEIEAKLRAAFPDEASFRRFVDTHAARERRFAQTREMLNVAARPMKPGGLGVGAEAVEQGLRFSPGAAAARLVRGAREAILGDVDRRAAAQVARRMTTPGQKNLAQFLQELEQAQRAGRMSQRLRGGFERGLPGAGGLLMPMLGSQ